MISDIYIYIRFLLSSLYWIVQNSCTYYVYVYLIYIYVMWAKTYLKSYLSSSIIILLFKLLFSFENCTYFTSKRTKLSSTWSYYKPPYPLLPYPLPLPLPLLSLSSPQLAVFANGKILLKVLSHFAFGVHFSLFL